LMSYGTVAPRFKYCRFNNEVQYQGPKKASAA
jgi:hypothetical protein